MGLREHMMQNQPPLDDNMLAMKAQSTVWRVSMKSYSPDLQTGRCVYGMQRILCNYIIRLLASCKSVKRIEIMIIKSN